MSWQSIERAPKDGSWFLAFGDGIGIRRCTFVCCWDADRHGQMGWSEVYSEERVQPTHWMPLPVDPEGVAAADMVAGKDR